MSLAAPARDDIPPAMKRCTLVLVCPDAESTRAAGRRLGRLLSGGDAVALDGSLGAGKTTLVQGIVAGLGSADRVTSPTFTLVNEYRAPALTIYHVDLYRLGEGVEADPALLAATLGLDDVVGAADGVLLVEWAELFPGLLPPDHLRITLSEAAGGGRTLTFSAPAAALRACSLLRLLSDAGRV